uniref:Sugar transporter SWEET1 n=1 Tax=Eucampia antarctica TaxID=49252 RepID=A0A7S2RC32_9STRA|mmetsp:Transcript_20150/g.19397  ORF Transcript_20150/g.19397 Transcript_20150/m.19397 type:complete len:233 (+) Transcript_20150:119-817(+)
MAELSTSVSKWVVLCGMLAPPASMAVILAPIPTIRKIITERSVMNFPLLPYSSMLANSFLWTVYGLLVGQRKIWATNSLGFILSIYYFYQFQQFCPAHLTNLPGTLSQHIIGVTFFIIVTALIPFLFGEKAPDLIGKAGVVICSLLFFSPLSKLKSVIQMKSARSIPLPFTISCCINCLLWTVVGYLQMDDFFVYFPNGVGLFFALIQLLLRIMYGDGPLSSKNETKYLNQV